MMKEMRHIFASPWLYISMEFAGILLIAGGVSGRMPLALLLTLLVACAIALLPLEKALTLVIASIPLAIAVPLLPQFDTFANWRVFVLVLAVSWFIRIRPHKIAVRETIAHIIWFEWALLGIYILDAASLLVAQDPVTGVRKLLFLANAGVFYIVLRNAAPQYHTALKRGMYAAAVFVFIFAAAQYISVQIVSLYDFWQGWAGNIIPVFYGNELGRVLAKSNTWFSFYESSSPTLRLFSVFPDSHSFALFSIISLALGFAILGTAKTRTWAFVFIGISSLAIFLSGSRGTWLTSLLPLGATILVALPAVNNLTRRIFSQNTQKIDKSAKILLLGWLIFTAMFPVASLLTAHAQGAGARASEAEAAFRRAKTILDVNELSNRTRLAIWRESLHAITAHPLLGVGLANFPQVLGEDIGAGRRGASAHNLYLDVTVEAGILAGILTVVFFAALLWYALRRSILWFAIAVLWIAAYNLVDVVLLNDKVFLAFLVLMALARTPVMHTSHEQT